MIPRRSPTMAAAAALAAMALLVTPTSGASNGTLSMDAATFAFRHASTHYLTHCEPDGASSEAENHGTVSGQGAYFGSVNMPDGTRLKSLRLVIRDNDTDFDAYLYLVRKRLAPTSGYDTITEGYKELAFTRSTGASMNVRRFSDTSVDSPTMDTSRYAYFVELVSCATTIDPLGVQISWSRG